MSYTPEEIAKAQDVKSRGGTEYEARLAIAQMRSGAMSVQKMPTSTGYSLSEAGGDVMETIKGIGSQWGEAGKSIVERTGNYDSSSLADTLKTSIDVGGDIMRGVGRTFGELYIGGAKLASTGEFEDDVKEFAGETAMKVINTDTAKYLAERYNALDPTTKDAVYSALGYAEGISELLPAFAVRHAAVAMSSKTPVTVSQVIAGKADDVARGATGKLDDVLAGAPNKIKGAVETGKEMTEKYLKTPLVKLSENVDDAARRSDIYKASTPEVVTALKSGVQDSTIDLISQTDDATRKGIGEILDVADDTTRGARTTSVPASYYAKEYAIADAQRKLVGTKIGQAVDNLPQATVDMRPAYSQVDDLLRANGVNVADDGLDFTQSAFTPDQRKLVTDAYRLMREAGDVVDARTVHGKDSLFARLGREASLKDVAPVMVKTGDDTKNLFTVMRDVYRSPLDNLSPEMRNLNKQYAFYRNLIDLQDDTIMRTAKVRGLDIDPVAQASVNIRRLDSDALSQPAFREAADRLGIAARELGYNEADPVTLMYFANDIKPFYTTPSVVTPGGFTGSIRGAIGQKIADMTTPDAKDAQKALRALLTATPDPKNVVQSVTQDMRRAALASGNVKLAGKIGRMKVSDIDNVPALKERLATLLTPDELASPDVQNHIRSAEMYLKEMTPEASAVQLQEASTPLPTATRQSAKKSSSSAKSTTQKIKDAILPGDTPGKEGGYIALRGGPKLPNVTEVAKKMSGEDYVVLSDYLDSIIAKEGVPMPISDRAEIVLDAMKVDTKNIPPDEVREWIATLLGVKDRASKKLTVKASKG